jgi:hypothetical protein
MKNRRYESSQISRCDSKSNRSCIKNQMMMWWNENQLIDQMIKSSDFLFFFEKINQLYHVMIVSFYHFNFYHCIASSIYLSTYSLNLASRCSNWSFLLIDQMNDVDQMKLLQKFFVFLSRQHLDEIVCWHLCSRASINTDSTRLNLLSQSVFMNINMFQLNIKLQHFFFQHAKDLTIVTTNVKFFHRIESNWFEKSFS